MRKNALIVFIAGVSLFSLPLNAAEEMAMKPAVPSPPPADLRQQAIEEQVRLLREERIEKMPYLDQGFIRNTITKEGIRERNEFIELGKKSLLDVLERSIDIHTPAIAARERIALARRRVFAALRELFPEMSWRFQHRDGSLGSGGPFNSQDWRWTFRQPIFRGGILWNTLIQERAEMIGAEKQYDVVISDLIREVATAYFKYNRHFETVLDHQRGLEKVRRFVEISDQKWEEQIISEIEHLNVQSLSSQMQFDYESARQEMELARLELQSFLGLGVNDTLVVQEAYSLDQMIENNRAPARDESLEEASPMRAPAAPTTASAESGEVPNLEVLIDLGYQHRPELQVESSKLLAARLEEKIKWGELLPRIDVVLEFGKLGEAFNDQSLDPKLRKEFRLLLEASWNAMGNQVRYEFENDERAPTVTQFQGGGTGTQTSRNTVTLGVLDGLDALVEAKEAEVEKLDQIEELENAEKEMIRDVKTAYFNYQRALIQLRSTLKRAVYRERLVVLSKHRLDNNEIQVSEYLQAEIDYLRERSSMHEALEAYFTARAELNRGVGIRDFLPMDEEFQG